MHDAHLVDVRDGSEHVVAPLTYVGDGQIAAPAPDGLVQVAGSALHREAHPVHASTEQAHNVAVTAHLLRQRHEA